MFWKQSAWRRIPVLAVTALLLIPIGAANPAVAAPARQGAPVTAPVPDPHQAGVVWFAPTGHTLRGSFLAYWNKYGGLAQFGYPITEEFTEAGSPNVVQYFERNRFEHHPENAGTLYEVLLGRLGADFHKPDPPAPAMANPVTRYFDATGHNVSPSFYNYWQSHGGLFVHGNPISEAFQETNPIDGKTYTVQYFERSRFELHPDKAGTPYEVMLGLLGTQLARAKGYFSGPVSAYPRLGHAADFSWIAGQVAYTRIQGGCTFIRYDDSGTMVQPVGPGWDTRSDQASTANGAYVVVHGHFAGPNEPVPMCPSRAYVVDSVTLNQ